MGKVIVVIAVVSMLGALAVLGVGAGARGPQQREGEQAGGQRREGATAHHGHASVAVTRRRLE